MKRKAAELAAEIVRCPVVDQCLAPSGKGLPCHRVVSWQGQLAGDLRYVPEPWSGHLDRAPILFVSSNPGGDVEGAPISDASYTSAWETGEIVSCCDDALSLDDIGAGEGRHLLAVPLTIPVQTPRANISAVECAEDSVCDCPHIREDLALPHSNNHPPLATEHSIHLSISGLRPTQFCYPPLRSIRKHPLQRRQAPRFPCRAIAVPHVTVDEHGDPTPAPDQVRAPRYVAPM
jgi:hypothetical protein